GLLSLELEKVELQEVFEQSVQNVTVAAAAKGVKITSADAGLSVDADRFRLVQILVNLLTNAIKFSPSDSVISLSAQRDGDVVHITVSDKGRGIPQHMLDSIFERFQQVQAADATAESTPGTGGKGLGLAICKALTELHGGAIAVESELGQGTKFTVA